MNALVGFRLSNLSNEELLKEIDEQTDEMFKTQKVPIRHIPARPDKDYDLLIGELMIRYKEKLDNVSSSMDKS